MGRRGVTLYRTAQDAKFLKRVARKGVSAFIVERVRNDVRERGPHPGPFPIVAAEGRLRVNISLPGELMVMVERRVGGRAVSAYLLTLVRESRSRWERALRRCHAASAESVRG